MYQHERAHELKQQSWTCNLCPDVSYLTKEQLQEHQTSSKHRTAVLQRRKRLSVESNTRINNQEANDDDEDLHQVHTAQNSDVEKEDMEFDESTMEADDIVQLLINAAQDDTDCSQLACLESCQFDEIPEAYAPYTSWPMLYLRQWKLNDGKLLSQTSFNTLLQLIAKLVKQFGDQPSSFPRNFRQIQQQEEEHLVSKTKVITLHEGKLVMLPVSHVIALMFKNKQIFENLHFEYEEMDVVGPFWTGTQWRDIEAAMKQSTPDAKLFPLVAYSDKSRVLRTRKGHILHPVIVAAAGVPREIWKQSHNKYTIGYISATADLNEALHYIVEEIAHLERGRRFCGPNGDQHLLAVTILVWLGDHEELNALASVYAKACRICYKKLNEDEDDWIYRSKEQSALEVDEMCDLYDTPRKKTQAYLKSKETQKHIAVTPLAQLQYFDVHEQTPPCPGHSENQGRTLRHLYELFQDFDDAILDIIDDRFSKIPRFPGLVLPNNPDRISLSSLIQSGVRLLSSELQSIRAIILFVLIDLLNENHLRCLKLHVMHAAGYYKKTWTKDERFYWTAIRTEFLNTFEALFYDKISFAKFPKGHDPHHDDRSIEKFGSFLNLDEMNFEGCHQTAKRHAQAVNGADIEFQILNKEDELQQLSAEFPHHFELYNSFLHPKPPQQWKLEGSQRGDEDWTTPALAFKGKMLRRELRRRGKNFISSMLDSVPVFSRLFVPSCDAILKALPKEDLYDTVLIDNEETPYVTVRDFFIVQDPISRKEEQWVCASVMAFDSEQPIGLVTGCPRVKHTVDNFIMVPASEVLQLVHLVPDFDLVEEEPEPAYFVNWWITFGSSTYPEQHRHSMQLKYIYTE